MANKKLKGVSKEETDQQVLSGHSLGGALHQFTADQNNAQQAQQQTPAPVFPVQSPVETALEEFLANAPVTQELPPLSFEHGAIGHPFGGSPADYVLDEYNMPHTEQPLIVFDYQSVPVQDFPEDLAVNPEHMQELASLAGDIKQNLSDLVSELIALRKEADEASASSDIYCLAQNPTNYDSDHLYDVYAQSKEWQVVQVVMIKKANEIRKTAGKISECRDNLKRAAEIMGKVQAFLAQTAEDFMDNEEQMKKLAQGFMHEV